MRNYLSLLTDIMEHGVSKSSRAGSTKSLNGQSLRWDLSEGFPILTTRKVSLRIAFEETMMFLRGEVDTRVLEEKGINIWKGNTSSEFLKSRGLGYLPEGSLGTGYSHQWRNFGGELGMASGVDQITNLLDQLANDPSSRRHVVTAWNPQQLEGTPLPPCHLMHMYSVNMGRLDSCFIMRSTDVPYGLPYNIMGYALLNVIFSKYLGYTPGELVCFSWDAHIYDTQLSMCSEQLTRNPRELPKLKINKELNTFKDIMDLEYSDIELINYDPHPDIKNKPPMAI